jgi:hypothetical protein
VHFFRAIDTIQRLVVSDRSSIQDMIDDPRDRGKIAAP